MTLISLNIDHLSIVWSKFQFYYLFFHKILHDLIVQILIELQNHLRFSKFDFMNYSQNYLLLIFHQYRHFLFYSICFCSCYKDLPPQLSDILNWTNELGYLKISYFDFINLTWCFSKLDKVDEYDCILIDDKLIWFHKQK